MCVLLSANIAVEKSHIVSHEASGVTFSAMVVGLGYKVGYAYMAGYNVRSRAPIIADNSTALVVPPESNKGIDFTVSIGFLIKTKDET